jgi:hypothetical protein
MSNNFSKKYFSELGTVIDRLDHKQLDNLVNVVWGAYLKE